MKDRNAGSARVSRDSGSSEKRKIGSADRDNGGVEGEYVASKRRKEKVDDRWTGSGGVMRIDGEKKLVDAKRVEGEKSKPLGDLKSKSSRRQESGSEKKDGGVRLQGEKEETKSSRSRLDSKRKSEKDARTKEAQQSKDSKDKDLKGKEQGSERERKSVQDIKREDVVHQLSAPPPRDNSPQSQRSMPVDSDRDSSGNKRKTPSSDTDAMMDSILEEMCYQNPYKSSFISVVKHKTGMLVDVVKVLSDMEYFKDPAWRPIYWWYIDHVKSDLLEGEIFIGLPDDGVRVEWVLREHQKAQAVAAGDFSVYAPPSSGTDAISGVMNYNLKKMYGKKSYKSVVKHDPGLLGDVVKVLSDMEYFKDPAVQPSYRWVVDHIESDLLRGEIFIGLPDDGQRVEWVLREHHKALAMAEGDFTAYAYPPPLPPSPSNR